MKKIAPADSPDVRIPEDNERVGYKSPPAKHRFKKGTSGNKKGRPKGSQNVRTILKKQLDAKISMRDGDRKIKVTKLEAMVASLIAHGSNGKSGSANALLRLLEAAGYFNRPTNEAEKPAAAAVPQEMRITFFQGASPREGQIIEKDAEGNVLMNREGEWLPTIPRKRLP